MNTEQCRQFIATSQWFDGASASVLDTLAEAAVYSQVPAGTYIWRLQECNTEVYGVVSGRVRISLASETGQEFAIIDRDEGIWLGEPCLNGDEGRIAEARAMTRTDLVALPRQVMLSVGEAWPTLYRNLFHHSVQSARGLYLILSGVVFYPLRARVAGRLLLLARDHGVERDDGVLLDIKLSQNDFARLAMGSRQRVNRIFRDWGKEGLVLNHGDYLLIRDMEKLEGEYIPFE